MTTSPPGSPWPATAPASPLEATTPVAWWSATAKVEESIRRSLPLLPGDVRREVQALLTPEALATMAAILALWAASHFVGVGEVADVVLLAVGVIALGGVAIEAAGELIAFAQRSVTARSEPELDVAARHFARAVTLIGVQGILTIFLRRRPGAFSRGTVRIGAPPPPRGRIVYRPSVTRDPARRAGEGMTSWWGDITISSRGSARTQRLVEIHERVHSILTPKLYFLRNIRVQIHANSYSKSQLLRYLEEALAETVAQVGVNGLRSVITGITFPVKNGYVTLARMRGEVRALVLGPVNVGAMVYYACFSLTRPEAREP